MTNKTQTCKCGHENHVGQCNKSVRAGQSQLVRIRCPCKKFEPIDKCSHPDEDHHGFYDISGRLKEPQSQKCGNCGFTKDSHTRRDFFKKQDINMVFADKINLQPCKKFVAQKEKVTQGEFLEYIIQRGIKHFKCPKCRECLTCKECKCKKFILKENKK